MPHVSVKLYPGRSEQQKTQLTERIVADLVSLVNCGEESISVAIEEVGPQDWTEKVYQPDIRGKWEKLYKKPGYSPPER
jgi:4-oxalocrotonate tautomerase